MGSKASARFVLLDTLSLFFRAYHALPELGQGGRSLQGAYGFTKMILRAFKDTKPTNVIAFSDRGRSQRDLTYKGYKATRPEVTDEVRYQIKVTEEILRSLDIPVVALEGFEADDLIATTVKKLSELSGYLTFTFTGDKDLLTLLRYGSPGSNFLLLLRRGVVEYKSYDKHSFLKEYGFPPELYPVYKALVGDPSDNVRGIEGIGEKRAKSLIREAIENVVGASGGLEESELLELVPQNLDSIIDYIKKRVSLKGRDALKTFEMNLQILDLKDDVEIPDLDDLILSRSKFKGVNLASFKDKLRELNFKSILKTIGEEPSSKFKQAKLFG